MTACVEYRGSRTTKGYGRFRFEGAQVLVHRWIVEQVEGRPLEPGEVVMHTCDNPPCFLYEHLRRATQRDNIVDAVEKGRHRFVAHDGEANGSAKLTVEQVAEIRRRHVRGAVAGTPGSTVDLAAEFGIGQTMIRNIVRGESWKN